MSAAADVIQATLDALRADASLGVLIQQRVYDIPPADPRGSVNDVKTPFVYLGPITFRYDEVGCGDGSMMRLRFYAASLAAHRREAWDVITAVRVALRNRKFTLAAATMSAFRVVAGGDVTRPNGVQEAWVDIETLLTTDSD